MQKFFMIVGIIVVAWIALGLIGSIIGFLAKAFLWVALIVGVLYIIASVIAKAKSGSKG